MGMISLLDTLFILESQRQRTTQAFGGYSFGTEPRRLCGISKTGSGHARLDLSFGFSARPNCHKQNDQHRKPHGSCHRASCRSIARPHGPSCFLAVQHEYVWRRDLEVSSLRLLVILLLFFLLLKQSETSFENYAGGIRNAEIFCCRLSCSSKLTAGSVTTTCMYTWHALRHKPESDSKRRPE